MAMQRVAMGCDVRREVPEDSGDIASGLFGVAVSAICHRRNTPKPLKNQHNAQTMDRRVSSKWPTRSNCTHAFNNSKRYLAQRLLLIEHRETERDAAPINHRGRNFLKEGSGDRRLTSNT